MVHIKHKIKGEPKIVMRGEPRYRAKKGLRRLARRTPGGKVVIHYLKKLPGKPICGICKKPLQGLKRGNASKIKKLSKTERTIQRPFGGMLCTECSREILKMRVRIKEGLMRAEEVPISLKQYVFGRK
ncbi:MAG: hypothetical protein ACP5IJ_02845 [Candidatus Nanoarchaeia archaeon]